MIITFCGHSSFWGAQDLESKVLSLLEEKIGNSKAEIFLGGYGKFDSFAYTCSKKYKKTHPDTSLVFVTPYISIEYLKDKEELYDSILYPPIENVPLRFAISKRNKYMVDSADYVIAFITHRSTGAYNTYKYAKRRGKEIFNLGSFDD